MIMAFCSKVHLHLCLDPSALPLHIHASLSIVQQANLLTLAIVFISLELWYYAILVLVAGYMKNAEVSISAFSIW